MLSKIKKYFLERENERSYPKELRQYIEILEKYIGNDNLNILYQNIINGITVKRISFFDIIKDSMDGIIIGEYIEGTNEIRYLKQDALIHGLLHAASTIEFENYSISGLSYSENGKTTFGGLNMGYTEILNRRIFKSENYRTEYYPENVCIVRLLELLFDNKNKLETAYFSADASAFGKTFLQYGTKEELYNITDALDHYAFSNHQDSEELETIKLVENIISRTNDNKKIKKAKGIIEEYTKSKFKSSSKKKTKTK